MVFLYTELFDSFLGKMFLYNIRYFIQTTSSLSLCGHYVSVFSSFFLYNFGNFVSVFDHLVSHCRNFLSVFTNLLSPCGRFLCGHIYFSPFFVSLLSFGLFLLNFLSLCDIFCLFLLISCFYFVSLLSLCHFVAFN